MKLKYTPHRILFSDEAKKPNAMLCPAARPPFDQLWSVSVKLLLITGGYPRGGGYSL